jgi:hypothetical protein
MPSHAYPTRRAMLGGALGLLLAGCGGSGPPATPQPPDERGLKQFAELYRSYAAKNRRGPRSLKELAVKGQAYPMAQELLRTGNLVVRWGAPLAPEGEAAPAVLAYLKAVPEQGGLVLLQDGRTIKTMTADEFRAASKAASP